MELVVLFGVGLSTGLSGAMIPGPLVLYTISEAFRLGRWAGPLAAAGHLLLESGFAWAIVAGCRQWLDSAAFRTTVAWVGGAGLATMGSLLLAQVPSLSLRQGATVSFRWGPLIGGACFSVVSPGFLLWWATIGASVILEGAQQGAPGIAAVGAGHALADVGWLSLVAYSIERGRAYCPDAAYRVVMTLMGLGLIVLGIGLPLKHGLGALAAGLR
jgi:threonine/homoserine/homoserine lactone efflux protein